MRPGFILRLCPPGKGPLQPVSFCADVLGWWGRCRGGLAYRWPVSGVVPRQLEPGTDARGVVVRVISPRDSITELTALLHRAYARQVELGLRPLAARQDDATTQRRVSSGECFVAELRPGGAGVGSMPGLGRLVGVIILNEREPDAGPAWFTRAGVCSFSQFAVDPAEQRLGVGRRLLEKVEQRAAQQGNAELALSMAEPDHQLRDYYVKRGFRIVGTWQWLYTNYVSLIMSKRLAAGEGAG